MKISTDLWIVGGLFTLMIGGSYIAVSNSTSAQGPEAKPHHTSYNSRPSGVKAFFMLLDDLGYRVERLRTPVDSVPASAKMLVVMPPVKEYPDAEMGDKLIRWMNDGGSVLLLLGNAPEPITVRRRAVSKGGDTRRVSRISGDAYTEGVGQIYSDSEIRLILPPNAGEVVSDSGGVIAAAVPYGRGRLIAISDPWIAANSAIGKADNAAILVNVVSSYVNKGEMVVFDEYSQGYGVGHSLYGVLSPAWRLALAQIAVAVLLAMYSVGRRFGSVAPPRESNTRRSVHEYVRAMGRLYRKSRATGAAVDIIYRSFWNDLCVALGVPVDFDIPTVVDAAVSAYGVNGDELRRVLEQPRHISSRAMEESELLEFSKNICLLRKEIGIAQ